MLLLITILLVTCLSLGAWIFLLKSDIRLSWKAEMSFAIRETFEELIRKRMTFSPGEEPSEILLMDLALAEATLLEVVERPDDTVKKVSTRFAFHSFEIPDA